MRSQPDVQRWLLLLGAAVTFFVFAPRGLLVGLVVLALLGGRCPQRLLRRKTRDSELKPIVETSQDETSNDGDWGATLVLVFEAKDPMTNVQQLKIRADENSWTLEESDSDEHGGLSPGELLERLRNAGLSYRLGSSAAGEFIFCLVRLPEETAQANLSFYPIDLQLDADEAQRYASDLGMLLALRSEVRDWEEIHPCESFDTRGEMQSPPEMLEDVWEDLHMRFCPQIPGRVFQHYPLVGKSGKTALSSILTPSQRLRMLLSLVGDDLPGAVGTMGPGLKLDQWKKPKFYNCLLHTCRNFGASRVARAASSAHVQRDFPKGFSFYFLMQEPRDATFQRLQMKFGRPSSALFQHGLLSGVVDKKLPSILQHYFGQQIGFYFAFLQHLFSYGFALSVLVAPLLAVYSVDWAKHLVQAVAQEKPLFLLDEMVSEISHLDASRSRWPLWSLMVGLTTTVWGQCVIESWHRQEKRLARQWGCHPWRRALTRPSFRGKLAVSRVDGRLAFVHRNRRLFQARVIAVNLCFLCLWALVFGVLGAFFLRTDQVQVATENYASLGAMFSVASVLSYHLFRLVANALTEAENHREESSWETSILLKKWALTVIVQCWAPLHLLFVRPYLWPCAYGEPELRKQLRIEQCEFWDQECCDQELRSGGQVLVSFAEVRGEAVLRHARQFIAGWLVSKIFVHNLLKWIVPRLCGFLCTRGLYPLLAVDFAEDVLTDLALESQGTRRRMHRSRLRRWLCPKRPRYGRSATDLGDAGPSNMPAELIFACECQLDKQDPWEVLDTATDLSVHFLVVSLTTVIYPFAPVLFLMHLLVEFQMDFFQLLDRRQPQPRAGHGLPEAWMAIFQSYVYVGALFNLAIVAFRTNLVVNIFGEGPAVHIAFFSTAMLLMVLVLGIVHLVIPRVPSKVVEHLQREREVEAFFIGQSGRRERTERPKEASVVHRSEADERCESLRDIEKGQVKAQAFFYGYDIRLRLS